jgi:KDO2-lipid IV(A) lauroyltransferase
VQAFEFAVVWVFVHLLRLMPRRWARAAGAGIAFVAFRVLGRLRRTGLRNLELAFPERCEQERLSILRGVYRNLGYQLAEFCQMPGYTAKRAGEFIRYDGLEHYLAAREQGKGVLVLTGHLGAWELSSFYHSLAGYPMGMVIRRLDNPLVDRFVNRVRCLHGNRVIHKDDFARGLIASMRANETVGILMDTNMTPPQGVLRCVGVHRLWAGAGCGEDGSRGGSGILVVGADRAALRAALWPAGGARMHRGSGAGCGRQYGAVYRYP